MNYEEEYISLRNKIIEGIRTKLNAIPGNQEFFDELQFEHRESSIRSFYLEDNKIMVELFDRKTFDTSLEENEEISLETLIKIIQLL